MGSMIYLTVGPLEVDWGKNNIFNDHSALFQRSDLQLISYRYADDDGSPLVEMKEGYSSPLDKVISRLALLGYSAEGAKRAFEKSLVEEDIQNPLITFSMLEEALATVDIPSVNPNYEDDFYPGEFFRKEIFDRLELGRYVVDDWAARYALDNFMENINPCWLMCLLAKNESNMEIPVNWAFSDVAENWVGRDIFLHSLDPSSKFLVVTEGSSDAKILAKALSLLRPEVADFFQFVDMEEGYPFPGAGNLHRFCQGLVSISIQNQVLVIYDNDAEGEARYEDTAGLSLPINMSVMRLPNIDEFKSFGTIGPNGINQEEINGRAAAIECYLDLHWHADVEPCVRWTSYNNALDRYQGELINKGAYARRFMELRKREDNYDFAKMEVLLKAIIDECATMAASRLENVRHSGF